MFMKRKFCGSFLSFHLYVDSENETLITILGWQIFLTHSLSHVDSHWVSPGNHQAASKCLRVKVFNIRIYSDFQSYT